MARRTGEFELVVYDAPDPDAGRTVLQLNSEEADTVAEILGAPRIAERFAERFEPVRLLLPYEEGGKLSELYALGAPIEERRDTDEGVLVLARLPRAEIRRFASYLVADTEPAETARAQ